MATTLQARTDELDPDLDVDVDRDLDLDDADEVELTEAQLTELALAADPDAELDADAVPLAGFAGGGLLPDWYMPAPATSTRKTWHRVLAVSVIAGSIAVCASGLCVTYGHLVAA